MAKIHDTKFKATTQNTLLSSLQEYAKVLLLLLDENKPIAEIFKQNRGILADITVAMAGAGGAWAGASIWASSLGFWGSIGYGLGLVSMPLWAPIAGGVGGTVAAAIAVRTIFSSLSYLDKKNLLALSYHTAHLMAHADTQVTPVEKDLLENILLGTGLKQEDLALILKNVPESIQDLTLPGSMDEQARRAILVSCWELAMSDGISSEEVRLFEKLKKVLDVSASTEELKQEARDMTKESMQSSEALLAAVRAVSPFVGTRTEEMIENLLSLNPREESRDRLRRIASTTLTVAEAGASILGFTTDTTKLFRLIMKAYVTARIYLEEPDQNSINELQKKACSLAEGLGLSGQNVSEQIKNAEKALSAEISNAEKVMNERK